MVKSTCIAFYKNVMCCNSFPVIRFFSLLISLSVTIRLVFRKTVSKCKIDFRRQNDIRNGMIDIVTETFCSLKFEFWGAAGDLIKLNAWIWMNEKAVYDIINLCKFIKIKENGERVQPWGKRRQFDPPYLDRQTDCAICAPYTIYIVWQCANQSVLSKFAFTERGRKHGALGWVKKIGSVTF